MRKRSIILNKNEFTLVVQKCIFQGSNITLEGWACTTHHHFHVESSSILSSSPKRGLESDSTEAKNKTDTSFLKG